jgi:hypothetical protein
MPNHTPAAVISLVDTRDGNNRQETTISPARASKASNIMTPINPDFEKTAIRNASIGISKANIQAVIPTASARVTSLTRMGMRPSHINAHPEVTFAVSLLRPQLCGSMRVALPIGAAVLGRSSVVIIFAFCGSSLMVAGRMPPWESHNNCLVTRHLHKKMAFRCYRRTVLCARLTSPRHCKSHESDARKLRS